MLLARIQMRQAKMCQENQRSIPCQNLSREPKSGHNSLASKHIKSEKNISRMNTLRKVQSAHKARQAKRQLKPRGPSPAGQAPPAKPRRPSPAGQAPALTTHTPHNPQAQPVGKRIAGRGLLCFTSMRSIAQVASGDFPGLTRT